MLRRTYRNHATSSRDATELIGSIESEAANQLPSNSTRPATASCTNSPAPRPVRDAKSFNFLSNSGVNCTSMMDLPTLSTLSDFVEPVTACTRPRTSNCRGLNGGQPFPILSIQRLLQRRQFLPSVGQRLPVFYWRRGHTASCRKAPLWLVAKPNPQFRPFRKRCFEASAFPASQLVAGPYHAPSTLALQHHLVPLS